MTTDQTMSGETCTFDQLLAKHVQLGNTRCDEDVLKRSPDYFVDSAVHDTLQGQGLIEEYQVYRKDDDAEITCIVRFGNKLNGHPGIVHGGIISTTIDNTFGWLFIALNYPSAFTANMSVNFR
jgi:acyl-coenzyme A thioesterase PaaI-like protein